MDLLTLLEWLAIIHQLPSNKVSRLSQISNEMLKHLGLAIHHRL